jgi:hypothetical protein
MWFKAIGARRRLDPRTPKRVFIVFPKENCLQCTGGEVFLISAAIEVVANGKESEQAREGRP